MRMIGAMMFVTVLLASSPALADDEFTEIHLTAGFESLLVKDAAWDFFSGEDWRTGGTIAAEIELWNELFLRLGLNTGDKAGRLYDRYDTLLSLVEPQLTLRKGLTVIDGIRPYLGITGTYTLADVEVDLWYPHALGQEDGFLDGKFGVRGAAGVELFLPRRVLHGSDGGGGFFKDFTMGLAIEAGYAWKQPIALDRLSQGKEGDLEESPPMTAGELDLGALDLNGFFLAMDFRFYF